MSEEVFIKLFDWGQKDLYEVIGCGEYVLILFLINFFLKMFIDLFLQVFILDDEGLSYDIRISRGGMGKEVD